MFKSLKATNGYRRAYVEKGEKVIVGTNKFAEDETKTRDENIFPFVLDAVKHYGTLGEIIKVMTDVYGRYRDLTII